MDAMPTASSYEQQKESVTDPNLGLGHFHHARGWLYSGTPDGARRHCVLSLKFYPTVARSNPTFVW
jgi:hypothetical protein